MSQRRRNSGDVIYSAEGFRHPIPPPPELPEELKKLLDEYTQKETK